LVERVGLLEIPEMCGAGDDPQLRVSYSGGKLAGKGDVDTVV
jgi:hypothetical protein